MLAYGVWCGRFDLNEQTINGHMLERWLLKSLINMEIAGKQGIGVGVNSLPGAGIDSGLVEIAFGVRCFQSGSGLYFAMFDKEAIHMEERIQYTSWIRDTPAGSYVAAGAFLFYGFRFLLCLEPAGFPDSVTIGNREMKLMHHINAINV